MMLLNAPVSFAQSGSGLLITPLNRTIQARSGAKDVAEFRVFNGLKTRMVIDVALQDLTQTPTGGPILSDPGTTPHSCAPWVTVPQGRISLAPGQEQKIRATVAIPRSNVAGSYHAAIAIKLLGSEEAAAATGSATARLVTQTILPIHVFINGTLKPGVELEGAALAPALGTIMVMANEAALRDKWALISRVRNTGNSMVRLRGDIIITSGRGELVGRYQINSGDPDGQAILPGSTVEFPIFIDSTLPDAQYPARINLRYQGVKRMEGYSAPMTLKPRIEGSTPDALKGAVALGTVERTGLQALIEPRVVIGNLQPNSVRTQRITVTNLEDFPVAVAASASGLAIDVDGEPIALPDATTGTWMAIAPATFRLGAQQSRVVSVRMNSPIDQGDRWGMLQFAISSANPATSTLTTTARTTVLLRNAAIPLQTDGEGEVKAKAEKVALTRSASGPIVSVTIVNTNARPLAFSSSMLQLMAVASDAKVNKPPVKLPAPETVVPVIVKGESDIVLLPKSSRRLDFELPANVGPTQYIGTMKLSGLAASNGAKATSDFGVQFKLNLTDPRPPAPTKPAPAKSSGSKPKASPVKPKPKPASAKSKTPPAKPKAPTVKG